MCVHVCCVCVCARARMGVKSVQQHCIHSLRVKYPVRRYSACTNRYELIPPSLLFPECYPSIIKDWSSLFSRPLATTILSASVALTICLYYRLGFIRVISWRVSHTIEFLPFLRLNNSPLLAESTLCRSSNLQMESSGC